jgi:hypothetical protein
VKTDVKDIFIPASIFCRLVLVRSANPDSLEFLMREDTTCFSWGMYFQVSSDGKTLTESSPSNDIELVYDRAVRN